jgi:hypothetical protein
MKMARIVDVLKVRTVALLLTSANRTGRSTAAAL